MTCIVVDKYGNDWHTTYGDDGCPIIPEGCDIDYEDEEEGDEDD